MFSAKIDAETLGVMVVFPLTAETVEIKNIAVKSEFQGKGIGSFFIDNYIEPIYENGIQAKHILVLTRQLNNE